MSIWTQFERNEDRATNGAKLVLGTDKDGAEIAVWVGRVHVSNLQFKQAVSNLRKERQSAIDSAKGEAHTELMSELTREGTARACILKWTGFTHKDGTPMELTQDNVQLIKESLPELFDKIITFGVDDSNYLGTFDEVETLKN